MVELRILEGEGLDGEDVTFSYNANFFLFATLEVARPMAHGRVQPAQTQVPVLTGMPVSGMAYLDRPNEAGYFIFPDLSVRHEGKYKLSFNLYEETKEDKDTDTEPSENKTKAGNGPGGPDSSFDWRMEVQSNIFTVYSAKKFPGLAESTHLSRTVAEQGCRVRIRRDVRMRRREGKNGAFDDDAPESDPYARGRAEDQDHFSRERTRSLSGTPSEDGRTPYDAQRQQHGHLAFGGQAPGYQAPAHFAQPQAPPPHQYQSAPASYQQQSPQYRQAPPPPPAHNNYPYDRQYPQSAYPSNPPREQRDAFESEAYRRASVPYGSTQANQYPAVDSNYNRPSFHAYPPRAQSPPMAVSVNLAPLKMAPMERKYENPPLRPEPLKPVNRIAPPLPGPAYERPQDRSRAYGQYSAPPQPAVEPSRPVKRTFESVFSSASASTNQPLFNGQRPGSSHNNQPMFDDDDDSISLEQLKMSYKRADGSSYSRELPVLE